MADDNYWKDRYKGTWTKETERLKMVADLIKSETGRDVIPVGLGAGTTEYLPGSAASQGHEKGGADLRIVDTDVYLEVTGPQVKSVTVDQPLWVRPDKIQNARNHPDHKTWVVHCLERDGTLRVIKLNPAFFRALDSGEFKTVRPVIRTVQETYIEIPATHRCVMPWQTLIDWLKRKEQ